MESKIELQPTEPESSTGVVELVGNKSTSNYCNIRADCLNPGNMCANIQDAGCVCKEGECKISCKLSKG